MQFKARIQGFSRDNFNGSSWYQGQQSSVVIYNIARCTGNDGFLVRCTGIDALPMLNVCNSCQQHSVWIQELEVGKRQCKWDWIRRTGQNLLTLANSWCWPNGAWRTWMRTCAPAYDFSKCTNYAWMFEHLRWLHGIELVQLLESAELDRFGAWKVMAEFSGFVLSLSSIKDKH